jgi:hypothetical protein
MVSIYTVANAGMFGLNSGIDVPQGFVKTKEEL